MWKYNNTDELYHYGVLGMKWGKRRAQKLQAKRDDMIEKRQIGTRKYTRIANKAYVADRKVKLHDARKNRDTVKVQNYKYDIEQAKSVRKNGTYYLDGNRFKSIYKVKSSTKEGEAVHLTINKGVGAKDRAKNALKKIGYLGVVGLTTAPAWYPKVKSGIDFISTSRLDTLKYDWKTGTISAIRK